MIRFKTATIQDADQIARLVNSAYRGDVSKQGWTTEADLLDGQRTDSEAITELIQTPLNQIELAIDDQTQIIVGSVHLIRELPETLYFGMLTVSPAIQGQGLGKAILDHTEKVAKRDGLKKIRCTVIPVRSELIAFYERRGFRATGKFEAFPLHDERFGIPKVEGLVLKEFVKNLLTTV